MAKPRIT